MKTCDFPVEFLNWYLETIHRCPMRPGPDDEFPSHVLEVPSYEPTPEEIARECARIRATWPPEEERRRRAGAVSPDGGPPVDARVN
jgi:hypothetical protein